MVKWLTGFIAALAVGVVLMAPPSIAADSAVALSASFVLNVLKFAPTLVGPSDNLPITMVVLGSDSYFNEMKSLLQGRPVRTRPIKIEPASLLDVQAVQAVVFSPDVPDQQVSLVLSRLKGAVLTFGGADGFASRGGAIEFHVIGDRVKFRVNRRVLQSSNVELSSRVLVLAEEIIQ